MMKVYNFFEKIWSDMFGQTAMVEEEEDIAKSIPYLKRCGREEPSQFSLIKNDYSTQSQHHNLSNKPA